MKLNPWVIFVMGFILLPRSAFATSPPVPGYLCRFIDRGSSFGMRSIAIAVPSTIPNQARFCSDYVTVNRNSFYSQVLLVELHTFDTKTEDRQVIMDNLTFNQDMEPNNLIWDTFDLDCFQQDLLDPNSLPDEVGSTDWVNDDVIILESLYIVGCGIMGSVLGSGARRFLGGD